MTPEELQLVKRLFQAAADLPADQRVTWLADQDVQDTVRAQVELQLRMFDSEPADLPGTVQRPAPPEPEQIDGYRLLEEIGEGGFGIVWRAEQLEPVTRVVALKVIKIGMDTREVVARFEAERQALAQMDHPHIAKVLDAGSTAGGRPFFAMELVEGLPITAFCDRHALDTEARLQLFAAVCDAVQHAHQKGVIHRDLKPSNILVAEGDSTPTPKVIDFGVAKATAAEQAKQTVFTARQQIVGTPEYMAPEQAEEALDIDTRVDVYSLGVLLYELLTGALPFDVRQARVRGYLEMLRTIREQEPPAPSTRISTLGAEQSSIAERRGATPTILRRNLRGDLDWIALRALEKPRERRYGSAAELAADVRRHLDHEPVLAGPKSTRYRIGRFVRRNRVAVTAVTAVLLALIGGASAAVWGLLEARVQRDDARKQGQIASDARATAIEQRDRAIRARNSAESAIAFVTNVIGEINPDIAGANEPTARDLLERMTRNIGVEFADQPDTEALLRTEVGNAAMARGDVELTERNLRRAVGLLEELDDVSIEQAYAVLWPYWLVAGQSLGSGYSVVAGRLRDTLIAGITADGGPDLRDALYGLTGPSGTGDDQALDAALEALREGSPVSPLRWQMLADLLVMRCRPESITNRHRWLETALKIYKDDVGLPETDSRVVTARMVFVWHLENPRTGDFARGAEIAAETLWLTRDHLPETHWFRATTHLDLGYCLNQLGRFDEADPHLRTAIEMLPKAVGARARMTVWALMTRLNWFDLQNRGRDPEAIALRQRFCRLLGWDPGITSREWMTAALGTTHPDLTEKLHALDDAWQRPHEADPLVREILEMCERFEGTEPDAIAAASSLYVCSALLLGKQGSLDVARDAIQHTVDLLTTSDEYGPTYPLAQLARCHLRARDYEAAERCAAESLAAAARTGHQIRTINSILATARFGLGAPGSSKRAEAIELTLQTYRDARGFLGEGSANIRSTFWTLIDMLRREGRYDEALELCRRRIERAQRGFRSPRAMTHTRLVMMQLLGRDDLVAGPATKQLAERPGFLDAHRVLAWHAVYRHDHATAIVHIERLLAAAPQNPVRLTEVAEMWQHIGDRNRALASRERAVELEPTALRRCQLAMTHLVFGEHDAALQALDQVLDAEPSHPLAHDLLARIHLHRGDLDLADRFARRRFEIDGDREMLARVGLARVGLVRGGTDLIGHFEAAVDRRSRPTGDGLHFDHARALERAGRREDAIATLERLTNAWPHEPHAWNAMARFLAGSESSSDTDLRRARDAAERAAQLSRRHSPAILATLTEAQLRTGDRAARATLRELRERTNGRAARWLTVEEVESLAERCRREN